MAWGGRGRTLVVGAAKIPACVNCLNSGVVHLVNESSGSTAAVTGCAANGRANACTDATFAARRFSPPNCFKRAAMGPAPARRECPTESKFSPLTDLTDI